MGSFMSFDVEKDFLSNVDYLKSLVKEIKSKSVSDFDSNLIYEVAYADMYVTDILTKVEDTSIVSNVNDIKTALDIIIKDIPSDIIESTRKSSDYTKILKSKYNKIDDGSFEEEVAYNSIEESSVVKEYIKEKMPFISIIMIMLVIQVVGVRNFFNFIVGISYLQDGIATLFSLIIMLIVISSTVCMTIDLIYLLFPFVRPMFDGNKEGYKLISIYAKSAIEEVDGELIKYKKIKSFDRIKRNEYWLQSMIDTLNSLKQSGKNVDCEFIKDLVDLQNEISRCSKRSKRWYTLIAKIEFMHDKYKSIIKGYLNEA